MTSGRSCILHGDNDDDDERRKQMNSVVLSGRLVRDPELRHTPAGDSVCSMRIAVDRAGQKQDDGEIGAGFFDAQAWGTQGENAAQYLTKGSRVAVAGELRFREWESQDGTKRNATEVRAFRVEFLDTRADREEREGGQTQTQPQAAAPSSDFDAPVAAAADDDIPF